MNKKTTEAIILRRVNFSESDRILTFITPDQGKIRAIAKGVRKEKSKLAGGLELLSISAVGYIRGKGDLNQVVSTRLHKHFDQIVKDYDRVQLAYKAIEWVDKLTEEDDNSEYFNYLTEVFEQLNMTSNPVDLVELWMRMQILSLSGSLPNMTHDCSNAELNEDRQYTFDTYDGCFKANDRGVFNAANIKVWRVLVSNRPDTSVKIKGLVENIGEGPEYLSRFMLNQLHLG